MAYSPIEQRYIDTIVEGYFPAMPVEPAPMEDEFSLEGVQLAAGPGTRTDAPANVGRAKAPTTPEQAADLMRSMPLETQSQMIIRRIAEDQKAGITGAVIPKDMTMRQNMVSGMQQMLIDNTGMDNARARKLSETMFGGENSGIPFGIGLIDITPFVIPLAAQEAGISGGEAMEAAASGEYGTAALKYGEGMLQSLDAVPGVALAVKGAKSLVKNISKQSGEIYATAQRGPFYTVNRQNPATNYGDAGERRIYPGTAIENRAAPGRSSVYGDETGKADQEIQLRLKPENNPAFSIADQISKQFTGKPYQYNVEMEPSSLKKQSAVGVAYDVAAQKMPGYGDSVFAAYKADPEYAPIIEKLKIKSYDDLVKKSYEQLEKETIAQFNALPINMSYHKGGEGNYIDSKEMLKDVHLHNHLYVYQGGDQHEFLKNIDKATGLNSNEMFRAVHDYFGHAIKGNTFGPVGEETAWASHAQMYSPLARIAMTAETRGQNSFVNYTPINARLAEQMENVRRAMLDSERSGNLDKVEQYKQALRDLGGQMQYAKQASVALPPEMTRIDYSGGTPDYLRSVQSPQGEELALEHYSKSAEMSETDPGKYGTAAAGREAERLSMKGAKKERTFFYEAGSKPEQVVVSVAPYKYEAVGKGLYDFDNDPLDIRQLAKVKNTSTIGVRDEASLRNDLERIIYERGFKGYVTGNKGNRVVVSFDPVEVKRTK